LDNNAIGFRIKYKHDTKMRETFVHKKYKAVITTETGIEISTLNGDNLPKLEVRANKKTRELSKKFTNENFNADYFLWNKVRWVYLKTTVTATSGPKDENGI